MEGLAPSLEALLEIRQNIENGESVRSSILLYSQQNSLGIRSELKDFLFRFEKFGELNGGSKLMSRPHKRALVQTLVKGLQGQPILPSLVELEQDIIRACDSQIESYLNDLPVIALIPLLVFQFPAFLILLLGPLVGEFLGAL